MQRYVFFCGGRALNGLGALPGYRSQSNSECRKMKRGSETAGVKREADRFRLQGYHFLWRVFPDNFD